MAYTVIDNVAGMFPAFVRGAASQKPSDALIQQEISDVAAGIDAALLSRFGEIIGEAYGGSFAAFAAAFTPDAVAALERINRYGAAAALGHTLASMGAASAERLAVAFETEFKEMMAELDGAAGMPGGAALYDHLFDPKAATVSPRPGLEGIAGGDQPEGATPAENGMSNFFGKFDRR